MAIGFQSVENDQEVRGVVIARMAEAGREEVVEVLRTSTLNWWTDVNLEMVEVFDETQAQWYPEHFATLTVPPGAYARLTSHYQALADAVAEALGAHAYSPLRSFTILEEPDPAPAEVPMLQRGAYSLTPIEAALYDELRETDLTFSVQTTIHSAGEERRPDFIVYGGGRPTVVEVDGHEFHHTKEQRTGDAKRERWLAARGFDFIRFTGSEVTADAQGCVRELRETLRRRRRAEGS